MTCPHTAETTFSGAAARHNLHGIYVVSIDDAGEWTRALLHSILFLRLLGLCKPREQWCMIALDNEEVSYASVDDVGVDRRVERVVDRVRRALSDTSLAPVAQVQLDLGSRACDRTRSTAVTGAAVDVNHGRVSSSSSSLPRDTASKLSNISSWATWVTNSLGAATLPSSRSLPRLAQHQSCEDFRWHVAAAPSDVYESWTFRLYVVDRHLAQRHYRSLADTLERIVAIGCDQEMVDRMPALPDDMEQQCKFHVHVRGVAALNEAREPRVIRQQHSSRDSRQQQRCSSSSASEEKHVRSMPMAIPGTSTARADTACDDNDLFRQFVDDGDDGSRVSRSRNARRLPLTESAEQDWLELNERVTGRRHSSVARSPSAVVVGSPNSHNRPWWNSLRWSSGSNNGNDVDAAVSAGSGSWAESLKTLRDVLQNAPTASGPESL